MKVQAKIVSSERVTGAYRFHLHFDGPAESLPARQYVEIEIPDPPPDKSDGQKAYEAHPPVIPWAILPIPHRNLWHRAAAAVTGKPAVWEPEPAPAKPVKNSGERFRNAYMAAGTGRVGWAHLLTNEQAYWEGAAERYEASKGAL